MDFTYGHSGHFSHYGMILVGFLYGVESLLWTLDLWEERLKQFEEDVFSDKEINTK